MNKKALVFAIAIGIIAICFSLWFSKEKVNENEKVGLSLNGQSGAWYSITTHSTSTVYTYATSAAVVINQNPYRQWAQICNISWLNTSTPTDIWLHETNTTTTLAIRKGIRLDFASSSPYNCFTFDDLHPYLGAVYAISSPTGTVSVNEK